MAEAGRVLSGRYELVEKLGAGGMGAVWRAQDRDLGREVAVKIFSPPEDVQPEERTELLGRFRREARAAAALDSPHIATIHDHGTHDGIPYLVMELIEGRSLEQVLRDDGRIPVGQALGWAAHICRALSTAHTAGVVHRDIKPANIIVRPDDTPVVLDFGIATFQEAVEAESKLTRTGHMPLGTVLYMAPERFRMEPTDGRADLYALGCVLYELLIGRPPFIGPAAGVMYNHLNDSPLRPSRARTELTGAVDQLLLDLMAKEPNDRPTDADEAAERLTALREGLEEAAPPQHEPDPEESAPVPEPEPAPAPEPEDVPPPRPTPAAPSTPAARPPLRRRPAARSRTVLAIGAGVLILGGGTGLKLAADWSAEADYTIVYARPSKNSNADDAKVKTTIEKAVNASGLKGSVDIAAVNSTTLELDEEVKKLPHVIAVIGETDVTPGLPGDDAEFRSGSVNETPVKLNACPVRGGYDGPVPGMSNAFALRPSPAATGARLGTYLHSAPDVRSVMIVEDSDDDAEFSERLSKEVSGDGRKASVYRLTSDISQAFDDSVTRELKKAKPDTIVLPQLPYEGPFTPRELRKAGFRGRVLTPLDVSCENSADPAAPSEDERVRGIDHYRYRDFPTHQKVAQRNTLDASHALAAALRQQSGSPDHDVLSGLLSDDLKRIRIRDTSGTLAFDEQGYLKDRSVWIDHLDGKRWQEERKLTPR
ncbi:serine/threonine-protein kinase [Streptomyces sp. 3N207]|uniref:serine/threonine-protein kinase n=1 Tax=Streptomyces sp. 3N207 TaxID=3457417 RepID=UPI003FD0010D